MAGGSSGGWGGTLRVGYREWSSRRIGHRDQPDGDASGVGSEGVGGRERVPEIAGLEALAVRGVWGFCGEEVVFPRLAGVW